MGYGFLMDMDWILVITVVALRYNIKQYIDIRLQYPSSDGIIYLYGNGQNPETLHITPNSRKVKFPNRLFFSLDSKQLLQPPCSGSSVINGSGSCTKQGSRCTGKEVPNGILLRFCSFICLDSIGPSLVVDVHLACVILCPQEVAHLSVPTILL